jgi:ABC-type bacteriocin/lantibiotic exporter with double-glycine peptidase domain
MEKWGKQRLMHDGLRVKNLIQTMELISEIKLQSREEQFVKLFNQDNAITQRTQRNRLLVSYFLRSLLEFCVIIVFVCSLGITLIINLNIIDFLPTLTLFIVILLRFLPGVMRIIQSFQLLKFSKVSFLELDEILKYQRNNNKILPIEKAKKIFLPKNKIYINKLSFNYNSNSNSNDVLSNVNLTFGSGDILGVSGESGVGKSTFISIIMGLVKPTSGNILINNSRLDNDINGYQKSIGYVSQNFSIVDSTVIQNITMNFDNKNYDERKLDLALEITNSKKFINQLDKGIFSNLGQSSYILSGGQKQRIAIARAIYHFKEILILDEATSSMDKKLEAEIMSSIKSLVKDKICLIVSHNKISFDICSRILEVKDGKIIEI